MRAHHTLSEMQHMNITQNYTYATTYSKKLHTPFFSLTFNKCEIIWRRQSGTNYKAMQLWAASTLNKVRWTMRRRIRTADSFATWLTNLKPISISGMYETLFTFPTLCKLLHFASKLLCKFSIFKFIIPEKTKRNSTTQFSIQTWQNFLRI